MNKGVCRKMIAYTSCSNEYFHHYYDMWSKSMNYFYPELEKYIALYEPTEEQKKICKDDNINIIDMNLYFNDTQPTKQHFYLARWLFLPYSKADHILCTQINCVPVRKQLLEEDLSCELLRFVRQKGGRIGGIAAAIFSKEGARKTHEYSHSIINNPPKFDSTVALWQTNNLDIQTLLCELKVRQENLKIGEGIYWITPCSTGTKCSHKMKIKTLKHYLGKMI